MNKIKSLALTMAALTGTLIAAGSAMAAPPLGQLIPGDIKRAEFSFPGVTARMLYIIVGDQPFSVLYQVPTFADGAQCRDSSGNLWPAGTWTNRNTLICTIGSGYFDWRPGDFHIYATTADVATHGNNYKITIRLVNAYGQDIRPADTASYSIPYWGGNAAAGGEGAPN